MRVINAVFIFRSGSDTKLFLTCVLVNLPKILRSCLWDMLRTLLIYPCSETDITRNPPWLDAKMSV